ncbi:MAG: GAF domain-containing protein, partial [Planctomycetota bacterium]
MSNAGSDLAVRRETKELSLLYEVSCLLERSLDLRDVVGPVLDALAEHMGMMHGTLLLVNRETGEIQIEGAHGLSRTEQERGRYRTGEGVTGQVVSTGKPAVVPRVSKEPLFLDRTGARREKLKRSDISFICVPIKAENEVFGALSADRLYADGVALDEDLRLLTIVGTMIAHAVRLRRSLAEE